MVAGRGVEMLTEGYVIQCKLSRYKRMKRGGGDSGNKLPAVSAMVAHDSKRTPEDMPPLQGSICEGPQSRGWHPGLWYAALSGLG
ncbi:hypothetical protein CYPRO_2365 [Cyclonatronum proteinivorum]|uniref:Uncharacterized protein n=1 Tax=Cyclonatronum proteinivorum TaxID=1457365 RepID=A0A345UMA5_9BACT|nr:hypothetical protein CYPRO_2365 [Cyclonatronum proteinivorum]